MPRLSQLSRSIKGRVALVTGAASGMGRATAHLFADEGAHVAVTDLDEARVQTVVDEITSAGGSAHGWALDVSDPDRIAQVVGEIGERFGGLDIVVNNAGLSLASAIDGEGFEESWHRSFEVHLTAHARIIRAALPQLRKSDAARIVNIASTEALGATKYVTPYTAAKHGVVGLTRALAFALAAAVLLVMANCFPFLELKRSGLEAVMTLPRAGLALYRDGYLALSVIVLAPIVVIPGVMLATIFALVVPLRKGRSAPWLIGAGRLFFAMNPWSMVEVFIIGVIVSLVKIGAMATVVIGISFWAYLGFSICFVAAIASLDRFQVWRAIEECQP